MLCNILMLFASGAPGWAPAPSSTQALTFSSAAHGAQPLSPTSAVVPTVPQCTRSASWQSPVPPGTAYSPQSRVPSTHLLPQAGVAVALSSASRGDAQGRALLAHRVASLPF